MAMAQAAAFAMAEPVQQYWQSAKDMIIGLHGNSYEKACIIIHWRENQAKVIDGVKVKAKWHHWVVRVKDVEQYDWTKFIGLADVYVTMNVFFGWRRKAATAEIHTLFFDSDYYKNEVLAHLTPQEMAARVLQRCDDLGIPRPIIWFSGRGIQAAWRHTPLRAWDLEKWEKAQLQINWLFADLGADANARDVTRILRLLGTQHKGSGETVCTLTPVTETVSFESMAARLSELAKEMPARPSKTPKTKDESKQPEESVARAVRKLAPVINLAAERLKRAKSKTKPVPPHDYNIRTLWEARQADILALIQRRWGGLLPPGHRDEALFVLAIGLSWRVPAERLESEVIDLAAKLTAGEWDADETLEHLYPVIRAAEAAARDETAEWTVEHDDGRLVSYKGDPRWRMTTDSIVNRLEITDEEAEYMKVLVPRSVQLARRREKYRATHTGLSWQEYLDRAIAKAKRAEAARLFAMGVAKKEIARRLGVCPKRVRQYLTDSVTPSSPLALSATCNDSTPPPLKEAGHAEGLAETAA